MHRNIKLLALFNFFTDFDLFSAILVIYFAQVTGSYILAMSLYSVTMISSAIFEVPTGIFSDYLGRKRTMVAGTICAILAVTFYAIGHNYFILFIGALFEGMKRAWYSGNNEALLFETLQDHGQKEAYDHYLGKTSAMFQIAAAIGIVLGGIIATWSFSLVMWLSTIPQMVCFFLACMIVEPKTRPHRDTNIYAHLHTAIKKMWSNKKLRLLSFNKMYSYAISESSYQFRSAFINTLWPIWAIGFSKVLSSLGAAFSFWYSSKLIKRFGSFKLLLVDNLYSKIINLISYTAANVFSPVLMATTSLLYGVSEVAESKVMQQEFSNDQRATLGSITSFAGNLAFGIYAIILGYMADTVGPTKALLISTLLSLPTVVVNFYLLHNNSVVSHRA